MKRNEILQNIVSNVNNQLVAEELGYDEVSAKSASYILRKLDQGVSLSDIMNDFPEISRMIDVIAGEHNLHPDDDFEEIEDVLRNDLEDIAVSGEEDEYFYDDRVKEAGSDSTIKSIQGSNIEVDDGDGVTTTIDQNNPNAPQLGRAPDGKLVMTKKPPTPGQPTNPRDQQEMPRAGDKIVKSANEELESILKIAGLR